jgi:NAD(P)-dependent dehydrogenase (short-subunit alcohol dehydrogenase family)
MKVIIVTGVSGNLGRAVAAKFLSGGCYVIGTVVPNDPVAVTIKDKNFETAVVDLVNEEATAQFVAEVIEKHGQVDAAVLTVGGFAMGKISDTRTPDIAKQFKLNFETAYNTARPVFSQMMKQKNGRIFMIGSRPGSGMHNSKGMVAYGLSKSLVFRLAELMNDEAKGSNVVTCVVVPSTIDTPQNRQSMPDADFSKWVKARDLASLVLFLCSEEGKVMNGAAIPAYGLA